MTDDGRRFDLTVVPRELFGPMLSSVHTGCIFACLLVARLYQARNLFLETSVAHVRQTSAVQLS